MRIVALRKPLRMKNRNGIFSDMCSNYPKERWYFNRSWYNRAVVEPVNGFCSQEQYEIFMSQVNDFERMILDSGIYLVKIYMSISKKEQAKRFEDLKRSA